MPAAVDVVGYVTYRTALLTPLTELPHARSSLPGLRTFAAPHRTFAYMRFYLSAGSAFGYHVRLLDSLRCAPLCYTHLFVVHVVVLGVVVR